MLLYPQLVVLCVFSIIAVGAQDFRFGLSPVDLAKSFIDGNLEKIKLVTERYNGTDRQSAECYNGFVNLRNGIERGDMWAIKVVDSWSKLQSGLLMGNLIDQGSYGECMSINEVHGNTTLYKGQYCITPVVPDPNNTIMGELNNIDDAQFFKRFNLGFTVCIPATCSPRLWVAIVNELLKGYAMVDAAVVENIELACDVVGKMDEFSVLDWIGAVFFTTTVILIIISTIYEYTVKEPIKLLTAFSLYSNVRDIFSLKESTSRYNIQCLHGIRSLAIICVIVAHSYMIQVQLPAINKTAYLDWFHHYDKILMVFVVVHSTYLFFFLSGFLIGWINFKYLDRLNDKTGLRIVPHMYIQRYLRLTPALGATMLLILTFFRFFGNGPLFNFAQYSYEDSCRKSWWTTLLYVQNIFDPSYQCPGLGGWYLGADTQMFLLSPLIFLPLWKFGKNALILPITLFVATLIGSGYRVWTNDMTYLNLIHQDKRYEFLELVFYQTHHRCSAWLVGIILSKIMYDWRDKKLDLTKYHFNKIMWIISFALAAGLYYVLFQVISERYPLSKLASVTHFILFHYFLILTVAWIVFASYYGYGGIINEILSWKVWLPVSRLTYSMFLCHSLIILPAQLRNHTPMYVDTFLSFKTAMQAVVSSFLVAILFKVAFESSYGHILNYITGVEKLKKKFAGNDNKDEEAINEMPLAETPEKPNKIYFNQ